jgi:hypothetical protein
MLIVSCSAKESDSDYYGYKTDRTDTLYVYLTGRTRLMDARLMKDRLECLIKRLAGIEEVVGQYIDKGDPIPPWVERSMSGLEAELQGVELSVERLIRGTPDPSGGPRRQPRRRRRQPSRARL